MSDRDVAALDDREDDDEIRGPVRCRTCGRGIGCDVCTVISRYREIEPPPATRRLLEVFSCYRREIEAAGGVQVGDVLFRAPAVMRLLEEWGMGEGEGDAIA